MTYGRIIDRIIFEAYGDTVPPVSVRDFLRGVDGKIGDVRKQIQEDTDYWFMESLDTINLVNAQAAYDLDADIKKEITLWYQDENNSRFPLSKVLPGQLETQQIASSEYPKWYYIDWNPTTNVRRVNLFPTPIITAPATRTLYMKCYRYLAPLSDDEVTFDATEDIMSIEAPWLLIYATAADLLQSHEEYDRMQALQQMAGDQLARLSNKMHMMASANYPKTQYKKL